MGMGQAEILSNCRKDDAGHDRQMSVVEKILGNLRFLVGMLGLSGGLFLPVMEIDPPHCDGADEGRTKDDECEARIHIFRGRAAGG
ncbi:hypothetical protein D3C80_1551500 [compost metagenome]